MIKSVLTHIGGIEAYGVMSIALFFAFFIGMLFWAFHLKRSHLDEMGKLPLDEEEAPEPGSVFASQPNTTHE